MENNLKQIFSWITQFQKGKLWQILWTKKWIQYKQRVLGLAAWEIPPNSLSQQWKVTRNLHIKQVRTKLSGKVSKCIWMYSHLKKDIKSKHKAYEKSREKKDWSANKSTP